MLGQLLRTLNPDELKRVSGDVFGRIYEYFLTRFADQKAHDGGEFFTPFSLVSLIAHVLDPDRGTVLDPACGSGGMFVQSARTVEEHGRSPAERLTFRGLEKNATTMRTVASKCSRCASQRADSALGSRSKLLFDGCICPRVANTSSASRGVRCETSIAPWRAASDVQYPSTMPTRRSSAATARSPRRARYNVRITDTGPAAVNHDSPRCSARMSPACHTFSTARNTPRRSP